MNASIASPTRALRAFAWWAKAALWLVLGLWAALSLTWGALHLVIVPRLDQWRPQLETLATRALGVKVTLGDLQAQTASPIPTFELSNVRLYDRQGREALHLDRVVAGLSVRSLWRLGFEQLVVEAPALNIRRTADGRILVAGLPVAGDSPGSQPADPQAVSELTNWLFSQPELLLRQGTLRWTDEARPDAPPLELRQMDLVLRNEGRLHQLRVDATPPEGWGRRFTLQAQLRHPLLQTQPGHWSSWTGTAYGEFPLVDLRALRQYVDLSGWLGVQVEQGQGALRWWADVAAGEVTDVLTDVAMNRLDIRWLEPVEQAQPQPEGKSEFLASESLALRGLLGRLELARTGGRTDVTARNLRFSTADGQSWPGGNLSYTQRRHPQTGRLERLDVNADQIDLAALHNVVQRLPANEALEGVQHWGQELQPSGLLQGLQVRWASESANTPASWQIAGRVTGLSLNAGAPRMSEENPGRQWPGRPGVAGANAQFDFGGDGGRAQLRVDNGHLDFPGVWAEPRLPLAALNAELRWAREPGGAWLVEVPELSWANAEVSATAQGSWRTSDPATSPAQSRFPGILDLRAQVASVPAARVQRFLPVGLPEPVRRYVGEAVGAGTVRNVSARVRGDLWQFPFENPADGEFTLQAALDGVALDYVPAYLREPGTLAWPALQAINGQLDIDRVALHIRGNEAGAEGLPGMRLSNVTARIGNFMRAAVLEVDGALEGPANEALALVNRSPLRAMTGEALALASIDGRTSARLRLELPLEDLDATRVNGTVRFAGNALRVQPGTPELRNTTGELRFTESGFEVRQASADMLGGRVVFDGDMRQVPAGTGPASSTETLVQFRGNGTTTAEGLRAARDLTPLARLADQAEGSAAYRAVLGFRSGRLELNLETDLQGLAVNLPPPLNKAAQARMPLRLETAVLASGAPGVTAPAQRDRISLQLGAPGQPLGGAVFEREFRAGNLRVLRGDMVLGAGTFASLPARGVRARASLGDIDLGVWQSVFAGPSGPSSSGASAAAGWQAYWPTEFSLDARRLRVEGYTFNDLVLGGSREGGLWRSNVQAQELSGYLEYQTTEPGRLYARLSRLVLASASASRVENFLQQQPASIPALDVAVESFELSGRKLGQLVVQAINRAVSPTLAGAPPDAPPEWRLTRLALTAPEARFEASGNWVALGVQRGPVAPGPAPAPAAAAPRRTVLNFRLDVDESGALLERFGMPGVLRGGKGTLEGSLGWLGSPMGIHYPSLGGQMKLGLERGQFLKADPGIAKLLGVLSLQSLPRRLALDFRDVFSDGFTFDFVRGDARVEQGVLSTNNLQMKGVNAGVLIEGSADLAQETQDITAVVVPDLNTGTASLIATIINPATGIGSLLAQFLLRQPLQAAATQTFQITGPWADPVVERVVRRVPEPEGAAPAPNAGTN